MPAYYIYNNAFNYITKSKDNLICLGFIVSFKCTIRLIKCLRAAIYNTVQRHVYIYIWFMYYITVYIIL